MSWAAVVGGVIAAGGAAYSADQQRKSANRAAQAGSTTTQEVAPELKPLAEFVANRGEELGNLEYSPYPYETVADFNPYQLGAFDMIAGRAMQPSGLLGGAEDMIGFTQGGGFLGPQNVMGFNPFAGAMTNVGSNPYAGSNPYLENMIDQAQGDVVRNYNTAVAPQLAAAGLRSGSFGNSGLQEIENQTRSDLAKQLGNISTNIRGADFSAQQGLAENALNRSVGAQQADFGRNAGLFQGAFDSERNRMMGASGMAPNIYQAGYMPGQMLQGVGATMQQQNQNYLNSWQDQWNQSQEWPFKTYDAAMAPFGRALGGSTTTTGQAGPQTSPLAAGIGGAMLGYQAFKGWNPPAPAPAPAPTTFNYGIDYGTIN